MTRSQLYEAYSQWLSSSPQGERPCFSPVVVDNVDLFENDSQLVNRLYFVAPRVENGLLHCFTFYEDNTFQKCPNGDLLLLHSEYGVQG